MKSKVCQRNYPIVTKPPFAPREEPTWKDVLTLFILPTTFLICIYLYPNSTQILEYKARNPTILTIVGSNFAHRSIPHLGGNLFGLWFIGGLSFVFTCTIERKRLYYYSFASYLIVLPFFANPFVRGMLEDTPRLLNTFESVGFSQTVAALVGFLALAIGLFLRDNLDSQISGLLVSAGFFLSGFTIVFVNFGGDLLAITVTIGSGLVAIGYVTWHAYKKIEKPIYSSDSVQMTVIGLLVFYLSLFLLFPKDVSGGFFGHMAGFFFGYVLPASGVLGIHISSKLSEKWDSLPN